MQNEVYTDLEREPTQSFESSLYHFVFHFNPYSGLWAAIHRDDYLHYWSDSSTPRIIRSKSLETLKEIIYRTGGDPAKIEQLVREQ